LQNTRKGFFIKLNEVNTLQLFHLMRYGTHFLLTIVLAWFCSKKDIASYETALLVASLVSFFFISGLNQAMVPYFKTQKEPSAFWSALLVLIAMSSIAAIAFIVYLQFFEAAQERRLLWSFLPFLFLNSVAYFAEFYLYVVEKRKIMLLYGLVSFGFYFVFVSFGLAWQKDVVFTFYLMIFWALSKCIFLLFIMPSYVPPQWVSFQALWKKSLPLVTSLFLGGSLVHILNLYIKHYFTIEEFVVFRYGSREFPLLLILANGFSMAYSGILSNNMPDHRKNFLSAYKRLFWQCFPIAILLMWLSNFLFSYLYGASFAMAAKIFNVFLLLILARLLFPQTLLLALGKQRYFYFCSLVELFLGMLMAIWLGSIFGLIGIAYGILIAYLVEKLLLVYFLRKSKVNYIFWIPLRHYLLGSFLLLTSFVLVQSFFFD